MSTKRKRAAVLAQRCLQALFLVLFLALTISAGYGWAPSGLFTRLDPLAALGLPIAARAWLPAIIPGLIILATALLLGRAFCGHVCPMGTTLDLARAALKAMLRPFCASSGKKTDAETTVGTALVLTAFHYRGRTIHIISVGECLLNVL